MSRDDRAHDLDALLRGAVAPGHIARHAGGASDGKPPAGGGSPTPPAGATPGRHTRPRLAAWAFCGFALLAWATSPGAAAGDLDDIRVFALGPLDGRAVLRYPDGTMAVLKLGDAVEGTRAHLVQVLADRAVLEDVREVPGRQPVRELVWLYKAGADGRSAIQRFSLQAPPATRIEQAR